jgi:hypothetical protein
MNTDISVTAILNQKTFVLIVSVGDGRVNFISRNGALQL